MRKPPPKARRKVRLNLELDVTVRAQIERVRERTRADSLSEVIRKALAVYDPLTAADAAGKRIILRGDDGKEVELWLL